jgi:hypothetical protein
MPGKEQGNYTEAIGKIMSDFRAKAKAAETLEFVPSDPGQPCPSPCPQFCPTHDGLGEAMSIAQVAQLFGCSMWTVRQSYMRQGLPHFRASREGKLVFFRQQVIEWILKQQQKGGKQK